MIQTSHTMTYILFASCMMCQRACDSQLVVEVKFADVRGLLGGSCVVISGVISPLIRVINMVTHL